MSVNQNPDPASEARRINAAAEAVDCRLEEAMERVLAGYEIPVFGLGADGRADRGDLASDLAEAARVVPPRPDPEGYELRLDLLYVTLAAIYDGHAEHVLAPARPGGTGRCSACGAPRAAADEPEQRCGGGNPTTMCDRLMEALYQARDGAFPEEEAERWLKAWPAADFMDWGNPGDGSMRAWVTDVVRYAAAVRILEGRDRPANPRTTRPGADGG